MTSILRRTGHLSAVEKPTIGDMKSSLVSADHLGWLLCDGREINISAYPQLFGVVGHSFGSTPGSSSFRLPDPRGRVPGFVGKAENTTWSTNTWKMGDISGEETHLLTLPEMPRHNHDVYDPTGVGSQQAAEYGRTDISGAHNHTGNTGISGNHLHTGDTQNNGVHAHEFKTNQDDFNNTGPDTYGFNRVGAAGQTTTTLPSLPKEDNGFALTFKNAIPTAGEHHHGFVTDLSGSHTHTISTDGDHFHRIHNAGGDQRHNNIQPTIWLGNLFVYGGKLLTGVDGLATPFSVNKILHQ